MSTITDRFATNLTASLDAITKSVIYTDIEKMYTEGRLQKDQMDKVIISFHEKALGMAGQLAEELTYKGYKFEELMDEELKEKKTKAELAEATKAHEISLLSTKAELAAATKDHEIAAAESKADLVAQQVLTEVERTALIENQKIGFLDNRVLEWSKISSEGVGMIQSGGNEAPQEMMDSMAKAERAAEIIALEHPQLLEFRDEIEAIEAATPNDDGDDGGEG